MRMITQIENKEQGVTLIGLTVYVIVMLLVVALIATLTSFFYGNVLDIEKNSEDLAEFNKFNMYMVEEVKLYNNSIISIENEGREITFASGNQYIVQDEGIYQNNIKICGNVSQATEFGRDEENGREIVKVYYEGINGFAKAVEYVLKSDNTFGIWEDEGSYIGENVGSKAIPIYEESQLAAVATGANIPITQENGKVYEFIPNGTYMLMNDFSITSANWIPIGIQPETTRIYYGKEISIPTGQTFTGTFNGNNKMITGLTIDDNNTVANRGYGLFSVNNGYIKDLSLAEINIKTNTSTNCYTGGIVGLNNNIIENCTIESGIITTAIEVETLSNYTGGIAGRNATNSLIKGSKNKGKINGFKYIGGIVGYSLATIENSANEGKISGSADSNTEVGGIVGFSGVNSVIIKSTNNGEISGSSRIGGIAGESNSGTVEDSTNEGKISGSAETSTNVGGIVGFNGTNSVIIKSTNNGEISGPTRIGGIAGSNSSTSGSGTIEISINKGKVAGTSTHIGGIAGFNGSGLTKGSTNKGEIIGTTSVGGITGYNGSTGGEGTVETSINEGKIIGTSIIDVLHVGGIVGYNTSVSFIKNCFNIGIISNTGTNTSSSLNIGGIAGYNTTTGSTITNCYNIGEVTGIGTTKRIGAVLGYNGATITGCYYYRKTTNVPTAGIGGGTTTTGSTELNVTQAKTQNSYSGWDFTNTWQIDAGESMPYLRGLVKPTGIMF